VSKPKSIAMHGGTEVAMHIPIRCGQPQRPRLVLVLCEVFRIPPNSLRYALRSKPGAEPKLLRSIKDLIKGGHAS
jgi:hypothetical protein